MSFAFPRGRPGFWLTVLAGSAVCWLAPYPPLTDLPDHAAQVALWRDVLLARSAWAPLFEVHLGTPYLIGYGLALPLAMVMPVEAAMKLLLSIAYVAFVAMCVVLRRRFGGDPRLDWLFPLGGLGQPWEWGFFTFLVAAPVALVVIHAAARHVAVRDARSGLWLVASGVGLLFSHGLAFVYAYAVALAMEAVALRQRRPGWRDLAPYAALAAAAVALFVAGQRYEARFPPASGLVLWEAGWWRLPQTFRNAFGVRSAWLVPLTLAALAAPWVLGARPRRDRLAGAMPLAVTVGLIATLPHVAMQTAFIHHRFALFLFPAYAWWFAPPSQAPARAAPRAALAVGLLAAAAWTTLVLHAQRVVRFVDEAADFEAVLRAVEPGQRALALLLDIRSPAADSDSAYLHYAGWYQARRGGLVDPSFAVLRPQVMRYRPEHLPGVGPDFEWNAARFDWQKHRGADYRYFFVRHTAPVPGTLFRGAPCPPLAVARRGTWVVYENRAGPAGGCPPGGDAPVAVRP